MLSYLYRFFDLFFPRVCVGCKKTGAYICTTCKKELIPHPDRCPFCHRITSYGQTCPDCFPYHRHLAGVMVGFVYTDMIKKLILQLKFFHKYDCAGFLGQRIARLVETNPLLMQAKREQKLYVTFVPSHRRRQRIVKGYNQSQLLAVQVSKALEILLVQGIKKQKHTASQTKRTRKQRLTNLIGAFAALPLIRLPEKATLIIVDDITTT
jgi:competence protein ComFC